MRCARPRSASPRYGKASRSRRTVRQGGHKVAFRRTTGAALLAVLAGLGLAACGGKTANTQQKSASVSVSNDTSLRGQLPAAIKSKGALIVGTDPSYAPIEFTGAGGRGF